MARGGVAVRSVVWTVWWLWTGLWWLCVMRMLCTERPWLPWLWLWTVCGCVRRRGPCAWLWMAVRRGGAFTLGDHVVHLRQLEELGELRTEVEVLHAEG